MFLYNFLADCNKRDCVYIPGGGIYSSHVRRTKEERYQRQSTRAYQLHWKDLDQRNYLDSNNVDCISNGCEDKQRRRGMAPPHQESPEVMPTILVLLNLLHKETTSIPTQLKMISEGKLRRYQRKTTRLLQCRINQLWDIYNDGSTSLDILLMECGQIYNGQW